MTNPLANETILNLPVEQVYGFAELTMPDGTKVRKLVQQARTPKGEIIWEEVDEKLKAFDARFADTSTVPGTWKVPTTEVLTAKERETDETVRAGGRTRLNMCRRLILGLGDPKAIIANKGLDEHRTKFFKLHPSTLSLLHSMAVEHGDTPDYPWASAAKMITAPYPDTFVQGP